LVQASGVLEVRPDQIVVHLMPRVNYPPRARVCLTSCCETTRAFWNRTASGSGQKIRRKPR
jgi:hypothetical protein